MLTTTTLLGISSNSWLMVWVFMEINSLAMCTMISKEMKKENESNTQALIYLIIQLTSSIILLTCVQSAKTNNFSHALSFLCLAMKTGVWPLHLWYMKTLSLMKTKHNTMKVLMTWQKILPMLIIPYFSLKFLLTMMSVMTMLVPMTKMKKESSFKTIMVASSLNNNGWLMLTSILSTLTFLLYMMIYSLSLIMTLSFFKHLKFKNSLNLKKFWESLLTLGNMGGAPPFMMFSGKLMILSFLLTSATSKEIPLLMMLMACLFMYHYMWSTSPLLYKMSSKTQLWKESKSYSPQAILTLTCLLPILTMLLDQTKMGLFW